jgi:hypothetical protein
MFALYAAAEEEADGNESEWMLPCMCMLPMSACRGAASLIPLWLPNVLLFGGTLFCTWCMI